MLYNTISGNGAIFATVKVKVKRFLGITGSPNGRTQKRCNYEKNK